jgi:hypothetical protein
MSQPIKISQLLTMSVTTLSTDDFFPIVDSGSLSTKRITVDTLKSYFSTGSFSGSLYGGTASYAASSLTASHSLTSSRSVTSSYASVADTVSNVNGIYDTIAVADGHGFKVGHAIRRLKYGESGGTSGYTTCSIDGDLSGSEALGLIIDTGSYGIKLCYQGIADFSNDSNNVTASYLLNGLQTGSVYFLSSSGLLSTTEPSATGSISKPMLVALTTMSGLIINSRGIAISSNNTFTSSTSLSGFSVLGSGSYSASLNRSPSFIRTALLCIDPNSPFKYLDELDSSCVFTTSSTNLCTPFLTTTTNYSSYTASFKNTGSWVPHVTSASSVVMLDLSQWKLKIYT